MDKENKDNSNCPVATTETVSALLKNVKLDSQNPGKGKKSSKKAKWMDKLRMDKASFDHLLTLVTPEFKKANCKRNPEERLRQALKYLATGKGCSPAEEELIIKTCLTFVEVLGEEYLTVPKTAQKWRNHAKTFDKWGFPNCMTAIVARHVDIVPPPEQEDLYCNEDGEPTMVLIAGVNGDFRFTWAECGQCGQTEDEEMLVRSTFYDRWQKGELDLPKPRTWPEKNCSRPIEYAFIGGNSLCMKPEMAVPMFNAWVEDPMEEKYNKRLYKALRPGVIALEMLFTRFGIFKEPIAMKNLVNTTYVVLVACLLHNYLLDRNEKYAEEFKESYKEKE